MLTPEKEIQLCEDVASIKDKLASVSETLCEIKSGICEDKEKIQLNSDAILIMKTENKTYSKVVGGIWALIVLVVNVLIIFLKG